MSQGFAKVESADKPFLICKGRISFIGEAKTQDPFSEEDISWVTQSFRIEGYGAGENMFYNFRYRPEWFQPGFGTESFSGTKEQINKQRREYHAQIYKAEGNKTAPTALFAGVGFDQDAFVQLAEALKAIEVPESPGTAEDGTPLPGFYSQEYYNAVTDVLRQYLIGNDFGYELKQAVTPGEPDEEGKPTWIKADKYKVAGFFELTEKNLASKAKRAEKAEPGTVKFLIDDTAF